MEHLSSVQLPLLSEKQATLLATFSALLNTHGIKLEIDPVDFALRSPCAIDVEHDEQGNMVCIGVYDGQSSYCFTNITKCLVDAVASSDLIAHNGVGDMDCLRLWGIPAQDSKLVWDTLLIGHVIDSSLKTYGLKDMAKRELGLEYPSYDDIVGKRTAKQKEPRVTLDQQPLELVAMYNAMDCYATYKIYELQTKGQGRVESLETPEVPYFTQIAKPAAPVFAAMENRGICADLTYAEALKTQLETQQEPIKASIRLELGDINLNSPKQLLEALHAKEIYPTLKNKPSTDKRALTALRASPVIDSLLQYSELDTLLSSFVLPYLERNQKVVHPRFSQTGTRTGRPSCSNPNLLQIPRRTANGQLVRRMFTPRPGMLMGDCDYGQIEPRVLAHLSYDPTLCELFNNEIDFHTYTAERLGISRDRAKVLNLSVGYRATFKSVAMQLKCSDKEAQNEIDKWWGLFPALRRWQEGLIYQSKRSQFCTTLLGRRIRVDGLSDSNKWKREAAERQLINNITQGSAADIMLAAMVAIYKDYPEVGLLAQVYDELLFEAPEQHIKATSNYIVDKMINTTRLVVPLTVDGGIGVNWSEAKI